MIYSRQIIGAVRLQDTIERDTAGSENLDYLAFDNPLGLPGVLYLIADCYFQARPARAS